MSPVCLPWRFPRALLGYSVSSPGPADAATLLAPARQLMSHDLTSADGLICDSVDDHLPC